MYTLDFKGKSLWKRGKTYAELTYRAKRNLSVKWFKSLKIIPILKGEGSLDSRTSFFYEKVNILAKFHGDP